MPFDGIGLVVSTTKRSSWDRLVSFVLPRKKPRQGVPDNFLPPPAEEPGAQAMQILSVGRALIANRRDWVQRKYRTPRGRFCAVGALREAAGLLGQQGQLPAAHCFLLAVATRRGFSNVEGMNDNSGHRDVLRAFDEAIKKAVAQYS